MPLTTLVLAALTAQGAPATTPAKANADDRIVCHSETITGSLAQRRKTCHTVAEWRQIGDEAERGARNVQDQGLIRPTNGG